MQNTSLAALAIALAAAAGVPAAAQDAAAAPAAPLAPATVPDPATAAPPPQAPVADQGISDIIVTAQKRAQNLQDVPIAITAVSTEQLRTNRIVTVTDLNAVVPNLTVRTQVGGNSLPIYTMRGLVASGSQQGADRGIAMYIDGVYMGAAVGSQFELAEIERIEVLRGPQGTLFGRNSTGGAVHFITPEPPSEFGVRQTVSLGNYDQRRFVTRVNTGRMGPLSATVTYTHNERDGDVRNLGAGTRWDLGPANGGRAATYTTARRLGGFDTDAVRAAVKLDVGDDIDLVYRFDYTDNRYVANALGVTYLSPLIRALYAAQPDQATLTPVTRRRPGAVNNAATVPSRNEAYGHALTATWRVSDRLSVKSIAAYRKLRLEAPLADISGAGGIVNTGAAPFRALAALGFSPALAGATIGAPLVTTIASAEGTDRQWSEEFQINYNSRLVTITAGGLYYDQTPDRGNWGEETGLGRLRSGAFRVYPNFVVPFAGQPSATGGRATRVEIRSVAAFAQAELHLVPTVDVIGGIRYTDDRKRGTDFTAFSATTPIASPIRYDDDRITFNVGVNWKPAERVLLYGKYSTGYISGGSLGTIAYAPETARSWEAGVKADLFDRLLRANLALFTVRYGALQFSTSGNALGINPAITQLLVNAGDARARGFEFEGTLAPARGLTLNAGVGFTDFRYLRLAPLVTAGNIDFLAQYRPKWTVNGGAQYVSEPVAGDARINLRLDANYRSRQTGLGGIPAALPGATAAILPAEREAYRRAAEIPGYVLVNGRLALEGLAIGGVKTGLALWARNMFDYEGPNYVISNTFTVAVDYERARTFGFDLTVDF